MKLHATAEQVSASTWSVERHAEAAWNLHGMVYHDVFIPSNDEPCV